MRGRLYVGVDPGVEGYFAWLSTDGWITFEPMPRAGGKLNVPGLCRLLHAWATRWHDGDLPFDRLICILEEVNAMPSIGKGRERRPMGATSAFSFGRTFGRIEAALVSAEIPVVLVRPHVWKKEILLPHERELKKDGAVVACERLFPGANFPTLQNGKNKGRVNHNAADALCLAEYGRRKGL